MLPSNEVNEVTKRAASCRSLTLAGARSSDIMKIESALSSTRGRMIEAGALGDGGLSSSTRIITQRAGFLQMADQETMRMIRERIREELTPDPKHRGKYVCPLCGSGEHEKRSGALSIDPDGVHGHCFSCGFHGDIFDLVAKRDGLTLSEATRELIAKYGEGGGARKELLPQPVKKSEGTRVSKDFSEQIDRAHDALAGSDGERYLLGRGFTRETMDRFSMGYEDHYFPDAGKRLPAIVLPYSRSGDYVAWRAIGEEKHFDKPKTEEAGSEPVFNAGALYSGDPVFVVESQLCAISIAQEGGSAIAIGGSGRKKLLAQLEKKAPAGVLILSLDNDDPGRKAQADLAADLAAMGVLFIEANISGDAKDPNELLQRGGGLLRANIRDALQRVRAEAEEAQAERLRAREAQSLAGFMDGFLDRLAENKAAPAISTGFRSLDGLLDGGLYSGLYILGAVTGLGKTTFAIQVCDNIARSGRDVILFSLEMAKEEIIAKSVSRISYEIAERDGKGSALGKTTRGILASKLWARYSKEEMELLAAAVEEYKEKISGKVWISEGVGNIGVAQIRDEVEEHIRVTGRLPVVVIDYLQILAPYEARATDKQNTDKNVLELKRLSRDLGVAVIGISSLNRENYTSPINNAAFKESGAIEYSSDVLIGIQFDGMDYVEGEADKEREKRIRALIKDQIRAGDDGKAQRLQVKILKHRNGRKGDFLLSFIPRFNYYREELPGFSVVSDPSNPFSSVPQAKKKRPL